MKLYLKSLLVVFLLLQFALPTIGQVRYNGDKFAIGTTDLSKITDRSLTLLNQTGLYLSNGDRGLVLHTGSIYPCIYSNTGEIYFYEHAQGRLQHLRCHSVRTLSDKKAKIDIRPLDSGLNAVYALTSTITSDGTSDGISDGTSYGIKRSMQSQEPFIEALTRINPDLVITDEDGNTWVNYLELIPVLVNAVNELDEILSIQEQAIKKLQNIDSH